MGFIRPLLCVSDGFGRIAGVVYIDDKAITLGA
jgi:hypothetical protein